jgi:hypothetical protein
MYECRCNVTKSQKKLFFVKYGALLEHQWFSNGSDLRPTQKHYLAVDNGWPKPFKHVF